MPLAPRLNPTLLAIGVRFAPPIKTGFIIMYKPTPTAGAMRRNAQVCSHSLILWLFMGAILEEDCVTYEIETRPERDCSSCEC